MFDSKICRFNFRFYHGYVLAEGNLPSISIVALYFESLPFVVPPLADESVTDSKCVYSEFVLCMLIGDDKKLRREATDEEDDDIFREADDEGDSSPSAMDLARRLPKFCTMVGLLLLISSQSSSSTVDVDDDAIREDKVGVDVFSKVRTVSDLRPNILSGHANIARLVLDVSLTLPSPSPWP